MTAVKIILITCMIYYGIWCVIGILGVITNNESLDDCAKAVMMLPIAIILYLGLIIFSTIVSVIKGSVRSIELLIESHRDSIKRARKIKEEIYAEEENDDDL